MKYVKYVIAIVLVAGIVFLVANTDLASLLSGFGGGGSGWPFGGSGGNAPQSSEGDMDGLAAAPATSALPSTIVDEVASASVEPEATEESVDDSLSEIRIERDELYFDGVGCENIEELKKQIMNTGTAHDYVFVYENALKGTYDEVNAMLTELKDALGINISTQDNT